MIPTAQKIEKRQNKQKLQKKLQLRQLTLFDALQQDIAVDWFKQNNPAFLALLSLEGMKQMINYIIIPGPEDQKMRSYKIPMIATQILSTPCPKVFELMFTEDKQARGGSTVGWLIDYFWKGQQNYVISGYVIKILNNLIPGNPHKVLQFMIKNGVCMQMIHFLQSFSIAEFLLRMIIVEDLLLNAFIKERLQIFNQIVQIYVQNKVQQQVLYNINFMLCESFTRLWSQKNKQLGRFSSALLKMVEVIIDYDDKYQEQKFLPIIVKLLADHGNIAPMIIMVIYKKIFKKLTNIKPKKIKNQNKQMVETFSSINLYLLQTIECIVHSFSQQFAKFLQKQNIFVILLGFVKRFQWNNIVLVQIEKIIKQSILKKQTKIYKGVIQKLLQSIKQWKQATNQISKYGRGYKGLLTNLEKFLIQNYHNNKNLKQFLQKQNLSAKFQRILSIKQSDNLLLKQQPAYGFRVVHNIAIPSYKSSNDIISQYSFFFQQTEIINKKYLMQNPADHIKHKQDDVLMNQIQNQNQLVYKLLTQTPVVNQEGQKKNNQQNNNNME